MRTTMKLGVLATALLIGGAGCATAKSTGAATGNAEPDDGASTIGDELAARYEACWGYFNAKQWVELRGCYADDAVSQDVDSGDALAQGADVIIEAFKASGEGFLDLKVTPQLVLVGDKAILGVVLLTGTNSAPLEGGPGELAATHRRIGILAVHQVALDDQGKVVEERLLMDETSFLGQLGLGPANAKFRPAIEHGADKVVAVSKQDETERQNTASHRAKIEAFNAHDATRLGGFYADDVIWTAADEEQDADKQTMLDDAAAFWKRTPDARLTPVSTSAHGDFVATTGKLTGTAMGKAFVATYVEIDHYRDGKIDRAWLFLNTFALAVQLGLVNP